MIKDRLLQYIIHPVFISLIIWTVSIFFIPPLFSRYRVQHIGEEYTYSKTYFYYSDLDSDGTSEIISVDLNDTKQIKIIVYKGDKVLGEEYDLKYQPSGTYNVYTEDFNNDGYKECYVFTMNQDSIFLNIIDPIRSRKIILSNRFIDFRGKAENSASVPRAEVVGMIPHKDNVNNDLLFIINSGFNRQPRNVYRYMVNEDSLIKSPESGAVLTGCFVTGNKNDSLPILILLNVLATGNLDETFPFSDNYSWLMVLDINLEFLFPPVKFGKNPSGLQVLPLYQKNLSRLVLFYDYFGSDTIQSSFCLFDLKGNKLYERPIVDYEGAYSKIFIPENKNKKTFYFLRNQNSEIDEVDSLFRVVNTFEIPPAQTGTPLVELDADLDGDKERIFEGIDKKSLTIVQNDFKFPVTWKYKVGDGGPSITQVLKRGEKPELYLQFNEIGSYIRYEKNPFFYFKYPFYAVLYLLILLFIRTIERIQQYRLTLKLQTEKKVATLQMKAIKNQVDPHFTLNILNAIGSLYATETNREKADYIFGKYARLIRQTVISSDQIIVTLEEELDFVKNYLDLERFRRNDSFNYSIDIDKNADMQFRIPRMLIHTFVENAIKYGIMNKAQSGLIKIEVQKDSNSYHIRVEDNGAGLDSINSSTKSTGKGLIILNELIELYYKLEKVKITYKLQNITEQVGIVSGTRVTIEIPQKSFYLNY